MSRTSFRVWPLVLLRVRQAGVWGCDGALGSSYAIGSSFVGYRLPAAFNALIRISTAKTAAVHTSARNTPHFLWSTTALGGCIPQRRAGFREPPIREQLREQCDEWNAEPDALNKDQK
jgi:hypothetical protein